MKQMNDRVFFDTNILIYSYSEDEPAKQLIARQLIQESNSFISTQVLQELTNTLTRKFKFPYHATVPVLNQCCQNNNVHINTETTIVEACTIASRYGFSFFDSLIIAAAIESKCRLVYSEDMQHNQVINGLQIVNPFIQ